MLYPSTRQLSVAHLAARPEHCHRLQCHQMAPPLHRNERRPEQNLFCWAKKVGSLPRDHGEPHGSHQERGAPSHLDGHQRQMQIMCTLEHINLIFEGFRRHFLSRERDYEPKMPVLAMDASGRSNSVPPASFFWDWWCPNWAYSWAHAAFRSRW